MSQASDNYDQIARAVREVLADGVGVIPGMQQVVFPQPIFPLTGVGGGGGASSIFAVEVTQDGGSAGDETHFCSFTYTATAGSGASFVTLGTGLTPWFSPARTVMTTCNAAPATSYATGFYAGDGSFQLGYVQETQGQCLGACS